MRTVKIEVGFVIWLLPFMAIAAYWGGAFSFMAWVFVVPMVVFTLLNVFSLVATFSRRKVLATRPPPPRGGFRNAVFGVLLWSLLFSWLWTIGWRGLAVIPLVSLVSLLCAVSIARGRARTD